MGRIAKLGIFASPSDYDYETALTMEIKSNF